MGLDGGSLAVKGVVGCADELFAGGARAAGEMVDVG